LKPEPQPEPVVEASQVPAEWAPFLVRAAAKPVEPEVTPAPDPVPPAPTPAFQQPRPEPRLQPRSSPSATAMMRPSLKPTVRQAPPTVRDIPEILRRLESVEKPKVEAPKPQAATSAPRPQFEVEKPGVETPRSEPEEASVRALQFEEAGRTYDNERRSIDWRLPAAGAGALFLAIGVGAWAGWGSGNVNEDALGNQAVTVKVPSAKPAPVFASAVEPALDAAEGQPAARAPVAAAPKPKARPPLEISLPEQQQAEVAVLEQKQGELESQPAVAEAPVIAASAKMPLPNAVVARTIGRIGYPCGAVSATSALGGGVFKVTCTSGHSYRAAPVNGRYRFRRI
jgi:hypothetical protein